MFGDAIVNTCKLCNFGTNLWYVVGKKIDIVALLHFLMLMDFFKVLICCTGTRN